METAALKAEQYRQQAKHARQLADLAASEVVRQELLEAAKKYDQLAEAAERRDTKLS